MLPADSLRVVRADSSQTTPTLYVMYCSSAYRVNPPLFRRLLPLVVRSVRMYRLSGAPWCQYVQVTGGVAFSKVILVGFIYASLLKLTPVSFQERLMKRGLSPWETRGSPDNSKKPLKSLGTPTFFLAVNMTSSSLRFFGDQDKTIDTCSFLSVTRSLYHGLGCPQPTSPGPAVTAT